MRELELEIERLRLINYQAQNTGAVVEAEHSYPYTVRVQGLEFKKKINLVTKFVIRNHVNLNFTF